MRWLDFAELTRQAARFDATVARTPDIDLFCSSTDWILPAWQAFSPAADPVIAETDDGFTALMRVRTPSLGRAIMPLEAAWGLASPFVSAQPERQADHLRAVLGNSGLEWDVALLTGLRPGGPVLRRVIARFHGRHRVGIGPTTRRRVASLAGGFEGFLSRRSPKFRQNLRRAQRQVARSGARYEYISGFTGRRHVEQTFERILDIELRSWKGRSDQGIDSGPARAFYALMIPRLAARGALRAVFVTRDGCDMAYVVGGLFGRAYRGLQVSFDHRFTRESVGNVAQAEMIMRLSDEGIETYDLGSDLPYKARWAEGGLETVTCVIFRR